MRAPTFPRRQALAVAAATFLLLHGAARADDDDARAGPRSPPKPPVITVSKAADGLGAVIALQPMPSAPQTRQQAPPALDRLPLAGRLTGRFGMRRHPLLGGYRAHSGVDLAAPAGAPVVATADGIVSFADWRGGYGRMVALLHGGGVETRFAHLSRILVRAGQRVLRGEVVGLVGSTGRSTGAHLHYEVRQHGAAIDPLAPH